MSNRKIDTMTTAVIGIKDKSNQATIALKIPRTVLSIEARREYCAKESFHSEEIRFEPDFCEDPILALENFKASSYDLIRLDIKMPEMDQETLAINKEGQTPILECNSTECYTWAFDSNIDLDTDIL